MGVAPVLSLVHPAPALKSMCAAHVRAERSGDARPGGLWPKECPESVAVCCSFFCLCKKGAGGWRRLGVVAAGVCLFFLGCRNEWVQL